MTSLDRDAINFLRPHAFKLSPLTHPNTFAYFGLLSKFSPQVMDKWAQVDAGAAPAKGGKGGKKEEVDMDDLFGDDDDGGAAAKAAAAKAK